MWLRWLVSFSYLVTVFSQKEALKTTEDSLKNLRSVLQLDPRYNDEGRAESINIVYRDDESQDRIDQPSDLDWNSWYTDRKKLPFAVYLLGNNEKENQNTADVNYGADAGGDSTQEYDAVPEPPSLAELIFNNDNTANEEDESIDRSGQDSLRYLSNYKLEAGQEYSIGDMFTKLPVDEINNMINEIFDPVEFWTTHEPRTDKCVQEGKTPMTELMKIILLLTKGNLVPDAVNSLLKQSIKIVTAYFTKGGKNSLRYHFDYNRFPGEVNNDVVLPLNGDSKSFYNNLVDSLDNADLKTRFVFNYQLPGTTKPQCKDALLNLIQDAYNSYEKLKESPFCDAGSYSTYPEPSHKSPDVLNYNLKPLLIKILVRKRIPLPPNVYELPLSFLITLIRSKGLLFPDFLPDSPNAPNDALFDYLKKYYSARPTSEEAPITAQRLYLIWLLYKNGVYLPVESFNLPLETLIDLLPFPKYSSLPHTTPHTSPDGSTLPTFKLPHIPSLPTHTKPQKNSEILDLILNYIQNKPDLPQNHQTPNHLLPDIVPDNVPLNIFNQNLGHVKNPLNKRLVELVLELLSNGLKNPNTDNVSNNEFLQAITNLLSNGDLGTSKSALPDEKLIELLFNILQNNGIQSPDTSYLKPKLLKLIFEILAHGRQHHHNSNPLLPKMLELILKGNEDFPISNNNDKDAKLLKTLLKVLSNLQRPNNALSEKLLEHLLKFVTNPDPNEGLNSKLIQLILGAIFQHSDNTPLNKQYIEKLLNVLQQLPSKETSDCAVLNCTPNKPGVIEFTYVLKQPTTVLPQPKYYLVKFRIPYAKFATQLQQLLKYNPHLQKSPKLLYQELLKNSNSYEVPPVLKNYNKDDLLKLTFVNGNLVGTRVVDSAAYDEVSPKVDSTLDLDTELLKKTDITNNLGVDPATELHAPLSTPTSKLPVNVGSNDLDKLLDAFSTVSSEVQPTSAPNTSDILSRLDRLAFANDQLPSNPEEEHVIQEDESNVRELLSDYLGLSNTYRRRYGGYGYPTRNTYSVGQGLNGIGIGHNLQGLGGVPGLKLNGLQNHGLSNLNSGFQTLVQSHVNPELGLQSQQYSNLNSAGFQHQQLSPLGQGYQTSVLSQQDPSFIPAVLSSQTSSYYQG